MKSNVISNGRPLSGLDNYEDGEKENTHWCTIYYNEYNKRLGDAFKGKKLAFNEPYVFQSTYCQMINKRPNCGSLLANSDLP